MKVFMWIVVAVLSAALVCSIFLNVFIFKLLGIHDMESFKRTMLAKELLDGFCEISDEFCVE